MTFHRLFFALCIATITSGCLFGGPDDDTNNGDPNSSNNTSAANSGENNAASNNNSGGDSDLAGCAGRYVGSFQGADDGVVAGELDLEGMLTITYSSTTGRVSDSAVTVTESGEISGTGGGSTITGTMDFSTCSMSGDWTTTGFGSGTWEAQKV